MKTQLVAGLAAVLSLTVQAQEKNVFCNPLNLPYRWALANGDADMTSYREAADPTMVLFKGEYYLFASKSGGYFHSSDLLHWDLIHSSSLPLEGYAPTVVERDGVLYFTCSTAGEIGTRAIWKTTNPKSGNWERIEGAGTPADLADPMLFWDKDLQEMYLYYGSSGDPTSHIQGWKFDNSTMAPDGDPVNLLSCSMQRFGWEVPGDYNETKTGRNPWLEGAWVNKYNGKYYLQYSAPGTEMKAYNDGVYVASSPLGPYTPQAHNPMSYRPEGFIAAAGHGSTFQDKYGNYWHISTGTISRRHIFERRLVMYPVFFDADGVMWSYTGYGDWPMLLPKHKISSPDELRPGWQLLSYGKSVSVSGELPSCPARAAVDEDIRTWWSAATAQAGEYIEVDLGQTATVRAIQVNMGDESAVAFGEQTQKYEYTVELSSDGTTWNEAKASTTNDLAAPHDLLVLAKSQQARYVRLTNTRCPYGKFSVSGLRVFGQMEKPLPAAVSDLSALRTAGDARSMELRWSPSAGAVGYNVRYGVAPDKLYHNYTVYEKTRLTINSLDARATYYVTVDAFNEAGETRSNQMNRVSF